MCARRCVRHKESVNELYGARQSERRTEQAMNPRELSVISRHVDDGVYIYESRQAEQLLHDLLISLESADHNF